MIVLPLALASLFPFAFSPDAPTGVADFSALLDAPAGRHGFVRCEDERFVTDAGPIRFNGVNLTGAANFPSHATADRLAVRLAALGINCVRLHYLDCAYDNFKQGPERPLVARLNTTAFRIDPERLEKLDYLVAALKRRGIYVNLNLRVARDERQKGASYLDEGLIATQKDYARQILRHVNPYTKLAYADDPAVALVEITNEDSPMKVFVEPIKWPVPEYTRFMLGYEKRFNAEMVRFLKEEVGVRAPITGTQLGYDAVYSMEAHDYLDDHAYWDHPQPDPKRGWRFWKMSGRAMVEEPVTNALTQLAARRPSGRPYTVSEYNHPFPNPYGAEGALLAHAFAAREAWNGFFLYSWDNREDREPACVDYFFSLAARTDVLAHLPACAALFLRGDLPAARKTLGPLPTETEWIALVATNAVPMQAYATRPVPRYDFSSAPLDWRDGRAIVSTPTAKFFTGFVRGRTFDLGDGVRLSFGPTDLDWATVSLVRNRGGWLVAVTGRAMNSGVERPVGKDWGTAPYLVEGVVAKVTVPDAVRAWALDGRGARQAEVPLVKGVLETGPDWRTVWYEVR